jgi:hypothetical protein
MTELRKDIDMENNILVQIHEGVKVLDREHNEIGHVDDVFLGAVDQSPENKAEGPSTVNAIRDNNAQAYIPNFAMGGVDPIKGSPAHEKGTDTTVRDRLLREGYVHIETGALSRDRVALPDQIEKVDGSALILKVTKDQLLKDDILNNMS